MIRIKCPSCEKSLRVPDNLAGRAAACPQCKAKFRIPEVESKPEEDPGYEIIDETEPEEPAPVKKAAKGANDGPPTLEPMEEPEQAQEEDDRPKKPTGKKKKKRKKSRVNDTDPFAMYLGAALGVGLLGVGLSFVWFPILLLPLLLSFVLSFAGGIWFLVVAFQDSPLMGLLCLFVPCFSLYYLVTHFEEEKRPFLVSVSAGVLSFACSIAASLNKDLPGRGQSSIATEVACVCSRAI